MVSLLFCVREDAFQHIEITMFFARAGGRASLQFGEIFPAKFFRISKPRVAGSSTFWLVWSEFWSALP